VVSIPICNQTFSVFTTWFLTIFLHFSSNFNFESVFYLQHCSVPSFSCQSIVDLWGIVYGHWLRQQWCGGWSIVPRGGNKWLGALGGPIVVVMEETSPLLFCHQCAITWICLFQFWLHQFLAMPCLATLLTCQVSTWYLLGRLLVTTFISAHLVVICL